MLENLKKAAEFIKSKKEKTPRVGVVLGSGLGDFVNKVEDQIELSYEEIPHFGGGTTVVGHAGKLILGRVGDVDVAVMQGRFHAYEGKSMDEVVFPARLLATLGVEKLILTNAAGGINLNYKAGDLVCIEDHINFTGKNPLIGPNVDEWGPRFPDMSLCYNPELRETLMTTAKECDVDLKTGVYVGVLGPTYETPAEIRMFRGLGGDMVGMSTVPEAIAAHHMGVKVCGISCVTNMAAGVEQEILDHADIKEQALKVMEKFSNLVAETVKKL